MQNRSFQFWTILTPLEIKEDIYMLKYTVIVKWRSDMLQMFYTNLNAMTSHLFVLDGTYLSSPYRYISEGHLYINLLNTFTLYKSYKKQYFTSKTNNHALKSL